MFQMLTENKRVKYMLSGAALLSTFFLAGCGAVKSQNQEIPFDPVKYLNDCNTPYFQNLPADINAAIEVNSGYIKRELWRIGCRDELVKEAGKILVETAEAIKIEDMEKLGDKNLNDDLSQREIRDFVDVSIDELADNSIHVPSGDSNNSVLATFNFSKVQSHLSANLQGAEVSIFKGKSCTNDAFDVLKYVGPLNAKDDIN